MATERQIAANRRNARNSTGPRSGAGKKRASRSSYRHGLSSRTAPSARRAKRIERLARKIAGAAADVVALECARAAAQAEFDLAEVRQVKVAVIERAGILVEPIEAGSSKSPNQPEHAHVAVRRALPELLKLDRYEKRATARRQQSLDALFDRAKQKNV
jgi:hypothetical protein